MLDFPVFSAKVEDVLKSKLQKHVFLIVVDIRRLDSINTLYGVGTANMLIERAAEILYGCFGTNSYLTMTYTGKFIVFTSKNNINAKIKRILQQFSLPVSINEQLIDVSLNFGVAAHFGWDNDISFNSMLECATCALQKSKEIGANKSVLMDMQDFLRTCIDAEKQASELISYAVREQRFTFYYQPFFCSKRITPIGVEMLARIVAKDNSIVMPSAFIDYLEKSDYLSYFEKIAIQIAAEKAKKWAGINIAFNASARSIKNQNFINNVIELCKQNNGNNSFTIEITERVVVDNNENSMASIINNLKSNNCRYEGELKIAIDDFGVEYSPLLCICNLPIDIIKIDRSFVREIENPRVASVVSIIISMAKSLSIKTIAEGIETKEQYLKMKELECDYMQGFFFSKPLPEEQIQSVIKV